MYDIIMCSRDDLTDIFQLTFTNNIQIFRTLTTEPQSYKRIRIHTKEYRLTDQ